MKRKNLKDRRTHLKALHQTRLAIDLLPLPTAVTPIRDLIKVDSWGTVEWGGPTVNSVSYFPNEGADEAILTLLNQYKPPLYFMVRVGIVGQKFLAVTIDSERSIASVNREDCDILYPWIADNLLRPLDIGDQTNDSSYDVSVNFATVAANAGLTVARTF